MLASEHLVGIRNARTDCFGLASVRNTPGPRVAWPQIRNRSEISSGARGPGDSRVSEELIFAGRRGDLSRETLAMEVCHAVS